MAQKILNPVLACQREETGLGETACFAASAPRDSKILLDLQAGWLATRLRVAPERARLIAALAFTGGADA
jgi:hypothetical protein